MLDRGNASSLGTVHYTGKGNLRSEEGEIIDNQMTARAAPVYYHRIG
ncbi:hypothetical protein [Spirosoma linguale]